MKRILYSLLISMSVLSGCSDEFLSTEDPNQVTDDSYWTSEKDVKYAMYGCYDVLQRDALYGGGPYAPSFRDHDCLSDNSYNAWGWNGLQYISVGSITTDHWLLLNFIMNLLTKIFKLSVRQVTIQANVHNLLTKTLSLYFDSFHTVRKARN